MANRMCRVWIKNTGSGVLELVDKHLDHGDWVEHWEPWVTAATVGPGEERRFESEESHDIPVIGNVMTGNEGWVLYRTFMIPNGFGSAQEFFIKIYWNLPYVPGPHSGVFAPEIGLNDP